MAKIRQFYKLLKLNIRSYSHFSVELFILMIITATVGINIFLRANFSSAQMPNKSLFFVYLENVAPHRNEKLVDFQKSVTIQLAQNHVIGKQILSASTVDKMSQSNDPKKVPLPTLSGSTMLKPNPASSELLLTNRDVEIQKYQVQPGDSVGKIASTFNISVDTIKWENNLSSANPVIRPGEILSILPTSGVKHIVQKGDTISGIAKKYGITDHDGIERIYEINGIEIESLIYEGQELVIPDGIKQSPSTPARQQYLADVQKNDYKQVEVPSDYSGSGAGLIWPIPCASKLSQRASRKHMAIDVPAKYCQVIASADGIVEIAGWQSGYGVTVLLNHGNGLRTRYAHGSQLLVSAGDSVKQGQAIMVSGNTGRSSGPHLHFEVKVGSTLQNPLSYVNP